MWTHRGPCSLLLISGALFVFVLYAAFCCRPVYNESFDEYLQTSRPSIKKMSFDQWLRKWGPWMRTISKAYGKGHYEGDLFQQNGTHFIKVPQIRSYFNLVQENKAIISRICETGFHEGHSALMWAILFDGDVDIISFDLCNGNHCGIGINVIKRIFPNVRLNVVRGDSRHTVPEFSDKYPNTKCNLISIDGGHVGDVPNKDIDNMKHLAAEKHFVVVDDANAKSDLRWLFVPGQAWGDSIKERLICPLTECQEVCDPPIQNMPMKFCIGKYCQI